MIKWIVKGTDTPHTLTWNNTCWPEMMASENSI